MLREFLIEEELKLVEQILAIVYIAFYHVIRLYFRDVVRNILLLSVEPELDQRIFGVYSVLSQACQVVFYKITLLYVLLGEHLNVVVHRQFVIHSKIQAWHYSQ